MCFHESEDSRRRNALRRNRVIALLLRITAGFVPIFGYVVGVALSQDSPTTFGTFSFVVGVIDDGSRTEYRRIIASLADQGAEGILRYTESQSVATQRLMPIAPMFGMSEETNATVMTAALRLLNRLGLK